MAEAGADDEARREEHEAREHLIDAEVEANETLAEAERLEEDATGSQEPRTDEEPQAGTD